MAEFPSVASLEAWRDEAIVAKWARLIEIRDEVNRALEAARQAKTIGNSLGAQVTLRADGDTFDVLQGEADDLAMLFIVSRARVERGSTGAALEVVVERAEGEKCPRCWRTVPLTGEGICERCTTALQTIA
jgi:isoleucyl-tRNA synthetase